MKRYELAWPFIALGTMLFVGGVAALIAGLCQGWGSSYDENHAAVRVSTFCAAIGAGIIVFGTFGFPISDPYGQALRAAKACSKCGYDLIGNVSGVCPECGTAISEPQRRALASLAPLNAGVQPPSSAEAK